jgi:hypothetical protein
MLALIVVIPSSWFACFLVCRVFAMWSPGKARRALLISWIPVVLFLVGVFRSFMLLTDSAGPSGKPGQEVGVAFLGVFCALCLAGALLNVMTCWMGARRENKDTLDQDEGTGISRQHS